MSKKGPIDVYRAASLFSEYTQQLFLRNKPPQGVSQTYLILGSFHMLSATKDSPSRVSNSLRDFTGNEYPGPSSISVFLKVPLVRKNDSG